MLVHFFDIISRPFSLQNRSVDQKRSTGIRKKVREGHAASGTIAHGSELAPDALGVRSQLTQC